MRDNVYYFKLGAFSLLVGLFFVTLGVILPTWIVLGLMAMFFFSGIVECKESFNEDIEKLKEQKVD